MIDRMENCFCDICKKEIFKIKKFPSLDLSVFDYNTISISHCNKNLRVKRLVNVCAECTQEVLTTIKNIAPVEEL